MDVKCAFLNDPINEEVCGIQSVGFVKHDQERKVYMLHKSLYGLKQAPRAWNRWFFKKCTTEHDVYIGRGRSELPTLCLYVDDLLITGSCKKEIEYSKHDVRLGKSLMLPWY